MRITPILTGLLGLISTTAFAAADLSMTVDSLHGTVEIQKAGQIRWAQASRNALLKNNDAIRVQDKSSARLKAANGDVMSLREGTQMLINLYEKPGAGLVSRHVTVFVGAVFFVIQKSLPRAFTNFEDCKVYTPTAVVAVRGTSFAVQVEKTSGKTSTQVISGTVLVRNIIRNSSVILPASYQSVVGMNIDPTPPIPLLDTDITALKVWTPAAVIDMETKKQTSQTKLVREQLAQAFDDKITIMPLINRSSYQGSWKVGEQLAQFLATDLKSVRPKGSILVEGSAGADPLETGKTTKARFVVTGDIEEFDILQHAQVSAKADAYSEINTAKVKIRLELIDLSTQQVLFEGSFNGEISAKNEPRNHWSQIRTFACSPDDESFTGSILGKSLKQAVEQSVTALAPYLHN